MPGSGLCLLPAALRGLLSAALFNQDLQVCFKPGPVFGRVSKQGLDQPTLPEPKVPGDASMRQPMQ
jgi:hypothetical protein